MIKLIWRTDVHMADRGPLSRQDDWTSTVLHKLDQIRKVAEKINAMGVIDGGDFFHNKKPRSTSHKTIRRIAELHKKYPCKVWANVGNHDCVSSEIKNLPKQPLEVLFSTGVFQRCYDEHEAWFEKDGVSVRVVGVPYHGTSYDMGRLLNIKKGKEDYLMVSAHLLASPAGGSMFGVEDIVSYRDLVQGEADVWAFGHSHADQGIVEISPKKWVINTGSLTRGSLHDDELKRQPKIVVLSFSKDKISLLPVKLAVAPPGEVFDLEGKVKTDSRAMVMEAYVSKIKDTLMGQDEMPLEDSIRSMEISEEVMEIALSLMEEADV